MHRHLPRAANLRVHLAHPPIPAALEAFRVPPHGVYVHDGERPVALLRDLDFRICRSLRTSSCVSKSSRQPLPHLSVSYLPHSRTHSIGSWDRGVFGQGQTMSGWNTVSKRSTSRVSHALVSRLTISALSALAPPTLVRAHASPGQNPSFAAPPGHPRSSSGARGSSLEYVRCFGELDLRVLHHLPAVAPRGEEVQSSPRQDLDGQLLERPPHHPLVVYYHPDVAVLVARLLSSLREGYELVPGVDERHAGAAPAQLHLEEVPVELEGLLDVADLEGDVVEPDQSCARRHVHIIPGF